MPQKITPLKILFIAAEVAPFANIGGLSQVMYYLPKALKKLGHEVVVFMPKYGTINEKKYNIKPFIDNLNIPTGENTGVTNVICNIKTRNSKKTEPTYYFLENMEYYEKRANVYGYFDDHIRFALLSRGALEFLKKINWQPDIIHANDWHTGYLINYLRTEYKDYPKFKKIASILTIHNLAHQGVTDFRYASPLDSDDGTSKLSSFFSEKLKKQNALKRGIIYADVINTVSERYSKEILKPEYGQGLDPLLKEVRSKIYGVLNGIDYDTFDPATDKLIKRNYSINSLELRQENKIDLQKEFDLPVDPKIPILSIVGRLDEQKGIDVIKKVISYILKEHNCQFLVVGTGDNKYREFFTQLAKEFPKQVGTHLMADWQLPRKVFSGTDILLLPSKFEPGGIVVIEAMRYGAVPVVRATGGLVDSVMDFDINKKQGNGFVFKEYTELAFYGAVVRALEIFKCDKMWKALVKKIMQVDYSWETSAQKYTELYLRAVEYRKETLMENPPDAFRR